VAEVRRTICRWTARFLLTGLTSVGGASGQTTTSSETTPATATAGKALHTMKPGDLVLKLEREGRIDSAEHVKVRLIPAAYGGGFEVAQIVQRSGRVAKGDVILRLDGKALQKDLEAAKLALDHATRHMAIAQQEAAVLKESNQQRLEQVAKARVQAEKELEIWEKFDGPDMVKSQELSNRQREYGLADQKEELAQLESMYQGTHLAKETKEIVLERNRRSVAMSESWLELARNDDVVAKQYRYPQRDMAVRDAARWAAADEAHTKVNLAASEERKKMELENAAKALREAQERVTKLESDLELLTVTAPVDGVMTNIELEPRDIVNARQTICEILNPNALLVKFNATAADLRVLNGGVTGKTAETAEPPHFKVSLPEYPDVQLEGAVRDVATLGVHTDNATHFPVVVALRGESLLLRIGLRCKLYASHTMSNVLTMPLSAITWENGEAHCTVKTNGAVEQRIVTLGPADDKMVAVVSGLSAGDKVVCDEAAAK
jgi:multidrug efflux pump subunit AcrA (membrane-fusion protein)